MSIYTFEQWQQDRTFKAEPSQEIDQAIYEEMLNCMPPKTLPRETALQALTQYRIPVHAGFLMGEPHSSNAAGQLQYLAFGMNDYGKGPRYFFLGLSEQEQKIKDGDYYYFESMSAFENDGLFPVSKFKDDHAARQAAADYEATLYRYTFKDGQQTGSRLLYEPKYC